jgi:anti-sigma factor RsiW
MVGQSAAAKRFARDAMVAHAVYSPEVRHPVEVAAAEQQHLVQWLSKRLGAPVKAPVLSAQGFELVGGRLLPGEAGARAQFMYQNAAGERVTVYVCVSARGMASQPTAFRFEQNGPVSAFYWVDRDFNYALSGEMTRARLMQLSDQVYQQLNG